MARSPLRRPLTVNSGAAITAPPVNQTVCEGGPASFSVTATGAGLSYQWRKNGAPIGGATNSSFAIPSAAAADAGSYDVVVTGLAARSPFGGHLNR
ncbi:MAG: hypothetical protein U0X75_18850 [Acidobacteriota bacterium]